jgi:16S rRNA (guanine966-N2)-methyltransferase
MRIIGGELKGRRFSPPSGFKARPTTDFARESLFNILVNRYDLDDLTVLDLFAGTGSISFEFVSRGCQHVTCVEQAGMHFRFIRKCVDDLGFGAFITPIQGDAFKYIAKSTESFDLIFSDAPFDLAAADKLPTLVMESTLLRADGVYIMEHSDKKSFVSHPNFSEVRKYGKVNFSFFIHQNPN